MTREEATNILKAKLECYKRQTSETDDCDDCDKCSLVYEQGTMGEQKLALEMAIMELEQQPCEDNISRHEAIRWVKTRCNPYGRHTLDFESGKKVIEHLEQMPSAQPEIIHCKECKFYTEMQQDLDTGICRLACRHLGGDGFCSEAELKSCKV